MDALFGTVFLFVWSVIATAGGLFGLFFHDRVVQMQIRGFLKMYEATNSPVFKWQAEATRDGDLDIVIVVASSILAIAGLVVMLSYFGVHVDLSSVWSP